jgi:Zn-dependent protease with chaperone function
VVGGGALFKTAQLRGGGRVIAEELGGRRLNPDTSVAGERQLLNVVEEMAIASGTPAPPVYLLDEEGGINAFAAGFTINDAVIGVTRGAVERLSRDELQGVIAHEFSHILNGDMCLNIRLIGFLHGILIIGMLGYFMLRVSAFSSYRHRRSSRDNSPLALLALGAGLMVVGFLGTFFGNLIKAGVSRQREFLADASAVQFTRQPAGIAGALKQIGGFLSGSTVQSPNAPEANHLFFGKATSGLSGLFATHPPLADRIRQLEPSWNGQFAEVTPRTDSALAPHPSTAGVAGLTGAEAAVNRDGAENVTSAVDHIGQPNTAHLQYAARLVNELPTAIVDATREPYGARALIYSLLIDRQTEIREVQIAHLSKAADPGVCKETLKLLPLIEQLDARFRLPLVDITLPALCALTDAQYRQFKQNITELVEADRTIALFEWSLQRILLHDLDAKRFNLRPGRVRHHKLHRLQPHYELLLSTLAHTGHRDETAAHEAFEQAKQHVDLPQARFRRDEECRLEAFDTALTVLEEAVPQIKRQILRAAAACITADRKVTIAEAELLRAMSASLGCPMPPLLST